MNSIIVNPDVAEQLRESPDWVASENVERPKGWVTDHPEVRPKFALNRAQRRHIQKVMRRAAKRA